LLLDFLVLAIFVLLGSSVEENADPLEAIAPVTD
jgi:hypothetical protein